MRLRRVRTSASARSWRTARCSKSTRRSSRRFSGIRRSTTSRVTSRSVARTRCRSRPPAPPRYGRGWSGLTGYTGKGIGVAVVDSGIAGHQDLRQHVLAAFDLTNGRPGDEYGHGTHIAGSIAGQNANYPGMAPGSHLLSLRVPHANGFGDTSDVIAAIDFAVAKRIRTTSGLSIFLRPSSAGVVSRRSALRGGKHAVRQGMVAVAAAGNFGKTGTAGRSSARLFHRAILAALTRGATIKGDRGAVRRCDGDLQLARSDV